VKHAEWKREVAIREGDFGDGSSFQSYAVGHGPAKGLERLSE
jgi:hypothetical protein